MVAQPCTAMFRRSCGSCCMSWTKPLPSSGPIRLEVGTRTSLKKSSDVSCAFMPIFSRLRPRLKPSVPVSTAISDVPLAPSFGSVLATTITRSASWPLLMKVLEPLITQ